MPSVKGIPDEIAYFSVEVWAAGQRTICATFRCLEKELLPNVASSLDTYNRAFATKWSLDDPCVIIHVNGQPTRSVSLPTQQEGKESRCGSADESFDYY